MQTNNEMFEKKFDIWGGGSVPNHVIKGRGSRKITFDHKGEGGGPKWPKKQSRDFRTAPYRISRILF